MDGLHREGLKGLEFRPLREQEFAQVVTVDSIAFAEQHTPEDVPFFQQVFDFERSLCAFDQGLLVGTSSSFPVQLTLPGGGILAAAGITWIAVLPTHRRRGILRKMMDAQREEAVRRGEAVAVLTASEGGIYGRFGYGPATSAKSVVVDRLHGDLRNLAPRCGRLVLLEPDQIEHTLPLVYERLRRRCPGELSRSEPWWQVYRRDPEHHRGGAGPLLHVVHEHPRGHVDGYVSYRVKEGCEGGLAANEVRVVEIMAADPDVYALLWEYLLGIDLSRRVSFDRARVDEPLYWLLDDPRAMETTGLTDYLWLSLLDIPQALSARSYSSSGELALEVTDIPAPQTAMRLYMRVNEEGSCEQCAPTQQEPHLHLDLATLSCAYLGGVSFDLLAQAGRVAESIPGTTARAAAMFSTAVAPYSCTMF